MIVEYLFEKIRNCFLPLVLFVILDQSFSYFEKIWLIGQSPLTQIYAIFLYFCVYLSIWSFLLANWFENVNEPQRDNGFLSSSVFSIMLNQFFVMVITLIGIAIVASAIILGGITLLLFIPENGVQNQNYLLNSLRMTDSTSIITRIFWSVFIAPIAFHFLLIATGIFLFLRLGFGSYTMATKEEKLGIIASWIDTRNSIMLAIIISLIVGVLAPVYWSIRAIGLFQQYMVGNPMGLVIESLSLVIGMIIFLSIVDKYYSIVEKKRGKKPEVDKQDKIEPTL